MKETHLDFVCSVGELASLFTGSDTLSDFLQKNVELIAEHMSAGVCSIYLFEEDEQRLLLAATKGLKKESVGKVSLKIGEGLVGLSLRDLVPVKAGDGSAHPNFKLFPGIGEEEYKSILVVPILRGRKRIGVVTVQHSEIDYFTDEDVKALRIITSQLAGCIENARLILKAEAEGVSIADKDDADKLPEFIKGQVGSSGFAYGKVHISNRTNIHDVIHQSEFGNKYSVDDFHKSLKKTGRQLEKFQATIEERLADVAAMIFSAHLLMLKDVEFTGKMEKLISEGHNPVKAIAMVTHDYSHLFAAMKDPYMQEKVQDIEDLGRRLIENLGVDNEENGACAGSIIVSKNIYPSDVIRYFSEKVAGVVSIGGGVTSHVSILSRSLDIPLVISDVSQLLQLEDDTLILLDAKHGNIYVNPEDAIVESFQEVNFHESCEDAEPLPGEGVFTQDQQRVLLYANINLLRDADFAVKLNGEGVGLYRTEFPFLVRSDFPTEDEQFVVYKQLVDKMKDKPVVFRTLDVGGDKVLSYYDFQDEENPFLGMRSIRFSLKEKDIFKQQVRAILRAGVDAPVSVMFPMISSVDEFDEAKRVLDECKLELAREKVAFNDEPGVGIMVELPSTLEILEGLAEQVDFFSIGTNDLTQYLLAVDRTNENVSYLYRPHHPAVLRSLNRIVRIGEQYSIDVSVCGDMGRDEKYLDFFIGIGVRKFSVDPHFLCYMKQSVAAMDTACAKEHAQQLLSVTRISDVEKILSEER